MRLTAEEQEMLDGKYGDGVQKAMELLVAVGDCYDAEQMIPVASVHLVSSNLNAGKGGALFIKGMAEKGSKVVIPTTTNPSSVEPWAWKDMGFSQENYREQMSISEDLEKMGCFMYDTCTPYLIGHVPRLGEHIAWGESSAIIYANSVLGSRTNREGGPTGLAAGITGRVPEYGNHLDTNRYGALKIIVNASMKGDTDYSTLGYFAGKIAQDRVPIFIGIPPYVTIDELKYLGAGLATSGSVSLYHAVSVTPEAPTEEVACGGKRIGSSDTFEFGPRELKEAEESLCDVGPEEADLVILGCPHASITQIRNYARLLSGKKVKNNVEIWILISHIIKQYAEDIGYAKVLQCAGARLVSNTCPNPMPRGFFKKRGFRAVATESAKMAFYVRITQDVSCFLGSLDRILDSTTSKA